MHETNLNPYASPRELEPRALDARQAALNRLRGPSLGLLLLALPCSVWSLIAVPLFLMSVAHGEDLFQPHTIPAIMSPLGWLIAYGAWCMRRGVSYRFAMTSAILASLPLLSPCLWMGIPFGIWALVVLRRPDVRAAFVSTARSEEY